MAQDTYNGYFKSKAIAILENEFYREEINSPSLNNGTLLNYFFDNAEEYEYSIYFFKIFVKLMNEENRKKILKIKFSDFLNANSQHYLHISNKKIDKLKLNTSIYYDVISGNYINQSSEKDYIEKIKNYYLFQEFESYLKLKFFGNDDADLDLIQQCFRRLYNAHNNIHIDTTSDPVSYTGEYEIGELLNDIEDISKNFDRDSKEAEIFDSIIKALKYPEEYFETDLDVLINHINSLTEDKYKTKVDKLQKIKTTYRIKGEYNEATGITLYLKNIIKCMKPSMNLDDCIEAVLVHEMFHAFNICSGDYNHKKALVYESLASYIEKSFMFDVKDDYSYAKKLVTWWNSSSIQSNPYAGAKLLDDDIFYTIFTKSLNNIDDAYNDLIEISSNKKQTMIHSAADCQRIYLTRAD